MQAEYDFWYFFLLAVFLGVSVFLNYKYDIEDDFIDNYRRSFLIVPVLACFYFIPFLFTYILRAVCKKEFSYLGKKDFWILIFTTIGVLVLSETYSLFKPWFQNFDQKDLYFIHKILNNVHSSIMHFIPISILWYFWDRRYNSYYGFSLKNVDLKIYRDMLWVMVPLIILASFQPDFLRKYPTYKPGVFESNHNVPAIFTWGTYEIIYALDFISLEFLFRGFMVIAFARLVGTGAILPMAAVYCYFHFGKPAGEAVSSIFGGAVLGILSYYTRSIYGGILIHMGIAILMDLAAMLQHVVKGTF